MLLKLLLPLLQPTDSLTEFSCSQLRVSIQALTKLIPHRLQLACSASTPQLPLEYYQLKRSDRTSSA